jgi:hypothetical protein
MSWYSTRARHLQAPESKGFWGQVFLGKRSPFPDSTCLDTLASRYTTQ